LFFRIKKIIVCQEKNSYFFLEVIYLIQLLKALKIFRKSVGKGKKAEAAWQKKYAAYAKEQPEPAKERQAARMVSMPSWELYEKTTQQYKDAVLPPR